MTYLVVPVLENTGRFFRIRWWSVYEAIRLEGSLTGDWIWLADFENEDDANDYRTMKEARNAPASGP